MAPQSQKRPRIGSPPGQSPETQPALRSGAVQGNERLTALTGAVLLILLTIECLTILRMSRLLTLHIFLGMLLIGPCAIKAASVLYRFARYYTGSAPYRRKGPPSLLLRLIGPLLMLSTACVFGSGIMLVVAGPGHGGPGEWFVLHRISFLVWLFLIVVHVVMHVRRLPRLLTAELRGVALPQDEAGGHADAGPPARRATQVLGGRGARLALLTASLLGGLVIALLTVHLTGQWQ